MGTRQFDALREAVRLTVEWKRVGSDATLIFLPGIDEDVEHNLTFSKLFHAFDTEDGSAPNVSMIGIEYPGHGRSEGRRGVFGPAAAFVGDMDDAVCFAAAEDAALVVDGAGAEAGIDPMRRTKNKPVILVGHSMGGLLALTLEARGIGNRLNLVSEAINGVTSSMV